MKQPDKYLPHIIFALGFSILPHLLRLPVWIGLWCALMWGYVLFAAGTGMRLPSRWVRILLFFAGLIGFLITYNARIGPNAYLGLLAIMAGLKPFEAATHRDRMITLFLAYFIVIASLFHSETLAATIHMFLSVFATTAVLVRINGAGSRFPADLRLSGIIMAQAMPLMLILFFLFPRLQGSLVGLPQAGTGKTGFSDRLRPGGISRLVENDEVAFRAEFANAVPRSGALYWRGIVFHGYDDGSWHRSSRVPEIAGPPGGKGRVQYSIALEPHDQRWLLALERPGSHPEWSRMYADFTIRNRRPVNRKKYYDMTAYTAPERANDWGVSMARRLPEQGNPKARKLAAELAEGADTAAEIVRRAMQHFQQGGFSYTLNPPKLGKNPVDDFLFASRKGYCEHYASAFAFLMRAAGVPARVVGGYLGGELNPYGNYFIVRQSDAHVWVEVWSRQKGWFRADPTEAVAPERITEGIAGALPEEQLAGRDSGAFGWLKQLDLRWDAVSTQWESWFYGYSRLEQKALLERLGLAMESWRGPLAVFSAVFASGFLIVFLYALIQLRPARAAGRSRAQTGYAKFCRKLARAGVRRQPEQGPADFARDTGRRHPELQPAVDEITRLYIRLRYKEEQDPALERHFLRRVKRFSVRGASRALFSRQENSS